MWARLSAIASLTMLGAYYLIALAGPPALVTGFVLTDTYADLRPLLIVGGFMSTALILVPILIPVRTEREPGITADRAREPALWQMVTEVAEATGNRPPERLLITPFSRASSSEETRWFGFVGRVQVVYLGLPLIETLTVDQLRAVVAHELGHHTHRHTRLLAIVYRGSTTFRRTGDVLVKLAGFRRFGILFALAWIVHRIYLFMYEALSIVALRHQEYEADREMVEICGRDGAATALRESVLSIKAWSRCWYRYVEPVLICRRAPEDLYGRLHQLLADPAMTTWCEKIRSAPPDDDRRFLDTHPPLADRLKAIERCPEPLAIRHQTDPATTLLADPPKTRKAVQTLLFGSTPTLQWSDPGILTAVRACVEQGLLLQEAVYRRVGTSRPTVAFILSTLEKDVRANSVPATTEEDPPEVLSDHLCALLTCALISAGNARFDRLDGTVELVDPDGVRVPLEALVHKAFSQRDIASLRLWLRKRDVPLGFQLAPVKVPVA